MSLFCLQRISIPEIKQHPWFFKNLPKELLEVEKTNYAKLENDDPPTQSVEEIMRIIQEAKEPGEGAKASGQGATTAAGTSSLDPDDELEIDVSGDYIEAI